MQLIAMVVILMSALADIKAQEFDEEALEQLVCSEDQTVRTSVIKCISLMPSSHMEIITSCDSRLAEIGNDHGKLLDFYCANEEISEDTDRCVTEAYKTRRMSEMEPVRPVVECLKEMISK